MEKETNQNATVVQPTKLAAKADKQETRFDRRVNWLKNHPVFSWLMFIPFVVGIGWSLLPKPAKEAVNNGISHISESANSSNGSPLLSIVKNYYDDLTDGKFRASDYFAPHIDKYFLVSNLTPSEVDGYFSANTQEFLNPVSEVLDSTFSFSKDPSGDQTVNFWSTFSCFRKSKMKYEYCLTRVEFIFDRNNKIKRLAELEHRDLKYFNKEILLEGSVGKLAAVFHLTFDYEHNQIKGTYSYPTRNNVTYTLTGTISSKTINLTEYTNGKQTATCILETKDDRTFNGVMNNTDGRQLNMVIRSSEDLFL